MDSSQSNPKKPLDVVPAASASTYSPVVTLLRMCQTARGWCAVLALGHYLRVVRLGRASATATTTGGIPLAADTDDADMILLYPRNGGPAHHGSILSVDISLDGRLVASAADDKALCIWDLETGELIHARTTKKRLTAIRFTRHINPSSTVQQHPESTLASAAARVERSSAGTIGSGAATSTDQAHALVMADKFGDVYAMPEPYSATSPLYSIMGHYVMVTCMAFTPNAKYLVTGDRDDKLRVSAFPRAFNIQQYLLGHTQMVTCLDFPTHVHPHLLISGSADGSLRLWNYMTGTMLSTIMVGTGEAAPAMSEDANMPGSAVAKEDSPSTPALHTSTGIISVACSPVSCVVACIRETLAAVGTTTRRIHLYAVCKPCDESEEDDDDHDGEVVDDGPPNKKRKTFEATLKAVQTITLAPPSSTARDLTTGASSSLQLPSPPPQPQPLSVAFDGHGMLFCPDSNGHIHCFAPTAAAATSMPGSDSELPPCAHTYSVIPSSDHSDGRDEAMIANRLKKAIELAGPSSLTLATWTETVMRVASLAQLRKAKGTFDD